jgi:hypothetical protein
MECLEAAAAAAQQAAATATQQQLASCSTTSCSEGAAKAEVFDVHPWSAFAIYGLFGDINSQGLHKNI